VVVSASTTFGVVQLGGPAVVTQQGAAVGLDPHRQELGDLGVEPDPGQLAALGDGQLLGRAGQLDQSVVSTSVRLSPAVLLIIITRTE
jgi:hypothetical protein